MTHPVDIDTRDRRVTVNRADPSDTRVVFSFDVGRRRDAIGLEPKAARAMAFALLDAAKVVGDGLTAATDRAFATFRARVKPTDLCPTCRKPLGDEIFDGVFDGVMSDAGEAFHHGCETF